MSRPRTPRPYRAGPCQGPDELRRREHRSTAAPGGAQGAGPATLRTPGPPPALPTGSPAPCPRPRREPRLPGDTRPGRDPALAPPPAGISAPGPRAAPPPPGAAQRPFVPPRPGTPVPEKFPGKSPRKREQRRTRQGGPGRRGSAEGSRPRPHGRGGRRGLPGRSQEPGARCGGAGFPGPGREAPGADTAAGEGGRRRAGSPAAAGMGGRTAPTRAQAGRPAPDTARPELGPAVLPRRGPIRSRGESLPQLRRRRRAPAFPPECGGPGAGVHRGEGPEVAVRLPGTRGHPRARARQPEARAPGPGSPPRPHPRALGPARTPHGRRVCGGTDANSEETRLGGRGAGSSSRPGFGNCFPASAAGARAPGSPEAGGRARPGARGRASAEDRGPPPRERRRPALRAAAEQRGRGDREANTGGRPVRVSGASLPGIPGGPARSTYPGAGAG